MTGSYEASLYLEFGGNPEIEESNNDNVKLAPIHNVKTEEGDGNPTPPIARSPSTLFIRSNRSRRGVKSASSMSNLLTIVSEMTTTIKNPLHWTDILYDKVMEVDGFDEQELVVGVYIMLMMTTRNQKQCTEAWFLSIHSK